MDLGDGTSLFHYVHLDHVSCSGRTVVLILVVMTSGWKILGFEVVRTTYNKVSLFILLLTFSEGRVLFDEIRRTMRHSLFFLHGLFMDNLIGREAFLFGVDTLFHVHIHLHVFLNIMLLFLSNDKFILFSLLKSRSQSLGRWLGILLVRLRLHRLFSFLDSTSKGRLASVALLPLRNDFGHVVG